MVICSLCQVVESRVRVDVRVESVSVHLHYILLSGLFSYDGYSVPDRTGVALYYHPITIVAPHPFP